MSLYHHFSLWGHFSTSSPSFPFSSRSAPPKECWQGATVSASLPSMLEMQVHSCFSDNWSQCVFSRKWAWWCLGLLPLHPGHTFEPLSWYIPCWLCEPAKLWTKEQVEIGLCSLVAKLPTLWRLEMSFFIQKRGNKAQAEFSLSGSINLKPHQWNE